MADSNMFGPIDVAISGMQAFSRSMGHIYTNIANVRTVDAGHGEPYRRVEALLQKNSKEALGGVEVGEVVQDMSPFQVIHDPGHPYADANGDVRMPNVNVPTEMINLTVATRAYQANVAVLRRYQQIAESSLELLR